MLLQGGAAGLGVAPMVQAMLLTIKFLFSPMVFLHKIEKEDFLEASQIDLPLVPAVTCGVQPLLIMSIMLIVVLIVLKQGHRMVCLRLFCNWSLQV